MSITTAGMSRARPCARQALAGQWLIDADGMPTDDPVALEARGSILPIGGVDNGHKGFGLSLLVEALTQGLAGYGRADKPSDWGAGVLVLAFAPTRLPGRGRLPAPDELDSPSRKAAPASRSCAAGAPARPTGAGAQASGHPRRSSAPRPRLRRPEKPCRAEGDSGAAIGIRWEASPGNLGRSATLLALLGLRRRLRHFTATTPVLRAIGRRYSAAFLDLPRGGRK